MSYQVLARKWRPRTFADVTGQESAVRALTHALHSDRLHHAYLFTGTRGVGKTTLARIVAKAVNCLDRADVEPCGRCAICTGMDEGRCPDLIEIDAASRTKVEDTRDLLDNVQYAPAMARFKVYLIDEVHMLSTHSFNALLKTLEEPPNHVKFLLATTDPQKIPVTVLSRCLQLHLRRLSLEQICARLETILGAESIGFEPPALHALAHAADGSLRDALSLLDQAIVYGAGVVRHEDVTAMLGLADRQAVLDLLHGLCRGDGPALLDTVARMAEHAANFDDALTQMLRLLQAVALAQVVPATLRQSEEPEAVAELAAALAPEDTQLYYQIALTGQRDLPLAPDLRTGFEMLLLRMLAFRPASAGQPPAPPRPVQAASPPSKPGETAPAPLRPASAAQVDPPAQIAEPPPARALPEAGEPDWQVLIHAMKLAGMTREFAYHCLLERIEGDCVHLLLDPAFAHLRGQQVEANLTKALEAHHRRPMRLVIRTQSGEGVIPAEQRRQAQQQRQQAAEQEIEQDPTVQQFRELFDARIVPGSTGPID